MEAARVAQIIELLSANRPAASLASQNNINIVRSPWSWPWAPHIPESLRASGRAGEQERVSYGRRASKNKPRFWGVVIAASPGEVAGSSSSSKSTRLVMIVEFMQKAACNLLLRNFCRPEEVAVASAATTSKQNEEQNVFGEAATGAPLGSGSNC